MEEGGRKQRRWKQSRREEVGGTKECDVRREGVIKGVELHSYRREG